LGVGWEGLSMPIGAVAVNDAPKLIGKAGWA
jgi:hypothetical protein